MGRVAAGVVDFHLGVRQVLVVGFANGQSYNPVLPSPQYQRFFGKRGDPAVEEIVLSSTDLFFDQIIIVVVLFPLFDKVGF